MNIAIERGDNHIVLKFSRRSLHNIDIVGFAVGSDPNDDCDEQCEMMTRHLENEDKLRESIRDGEQGQNEDNGDDPEPIID